MIVTLALCLALAVQEKAAPVELPAKLVADRFFVHPATGEGSLTLFTDTGGGLFITAKAADRLKLARKKVNADGRDIEAVILPEFKPEASIPPVDVMDGAMPILPAEEEAGLPEPVDGMLGQAWFRDRVWTFDYPAGKLLWRPAGDLPEGGTQAKLGFSTGPEGRRQSHYPRITIRVDGQEIETLFDTGATMRLSEKALKALGDSGPAARASSFIGRSILDRWREKHPDWRVIENADTLARGAPIIEVPKVEIAGHEVGPVWFAARPDKNFGEWMSKWMDRRIEGAIGGNALRHFRITVHYPKAIAVFERAP